jgi:hypothetical protein
MTKPKPTNEERIEMLEAELSLTKKQCKAMLKDQDRLLNVILPISPNVPTFKQIITDLKKDMRTMRKNNSLMLKQVTLMEKRLAKHIAKTKPQKAKTTKAK